MFRYRTKIRFRNRYSKAGTPPVPLFPPANTVAPVVSGNTAAGSSLSSTNGTWTNSPTGYTYQWRKNGSNIVGATNNTYATVTGDINATIDCVVTATNADGSASKDSNDITVTTPSISINDMFDIQLWTGNAIVRDIAFDMSPDMFWTKRRDTTANHIITDKVRGGNNYFVSNDALAAATTAQFVSAMVDNLMTIGNNPAVNGNAGTYVNWAFKEYPGFFDIVSYVGNGANRTIAHNLGKEPGMIIVKNLDATQGPVVYHKFAAANPGTIYREMHSSAAWNINNARWNDTPATETEFSLGTATQVNGASQNHVAYLFAHDPAGFIQAGVYTGNGNANGPEIDLGWSPQWLLIRSLDAGNWTVYDTTRGFVVGSSARVWLNQSAAEGSDSFINPTPTGFKPVSSASSVNTSGVKYIYLAIKAP